jgi:lipid-A-disaccharide synthase
MRTYKVYFIVGEPSGDLLAGRLIKALDENKNANFRYYGIGGENMTAGGFRSLFDNSGLAKMGFVEVLPSVPRIVRQIKTIMANIKKVKPDVIITVDSWSFAFNIIKKIKKDKAIKAPVIHYVAPQVWAWRAKRVQQMKGKVDHLMTLLPTEPELFDGYVDATFVGHPVLERCRVDKTAAAEFRAKYGLRSKNRVVCLLPGSRTSEVKYLLPVLTKAVALLAKRDPELCIVIPTVTTVGGKVARATRKWKLQTVLVLGEQERYTAFSTCNAAIAASGTVSLELAACKVPHAIIYKVNRLTAYLARKLLKIKYVNLINLLQGREIVPELLQEKCTPENIADEVMTLLEDDAIRNNQQKQMASALSLLANKDGSAPSDKAAAVVLDVLKNR